MMRRRSMLLAVLPVFVLASCALGCGLGSGSPAGAQGVEFRGGHWYTGSGFEDTVYYEVDGLLTLDRPDTVERVVDLGDGYVIPPFGDAHNHRPDGWPGTGRHVSQFLQHGIFYVMNPNSFPALTAGIRDSVNHPGSVDVLFSNGGLTPPGSHVTRLYERNLERGVFPDGWTEERLDGEGFFVIRDRSDLEGRWPAILAGRPDFIKVFMGFSEEHDRRAADSSYIGMRGIDPSLVPLIVERAHTAGRRVAAHIETAADFRIAVRSGVDIIAHMPASWRIGEAAGYEGESIDRWLLAEADAAEAARRDVAVVTHVHGGFVDPSMRRIHEHNLGLLQRHGVRLALGSDSYGQTALLDAFFLQSTGLFSAGEVLRIASESTARVIFPDRRIGRLADGHEASFLVVEGDPIADPLFAVREGMQASLDGVTSRIRLRVKQGRVLHEQ